VAVGTLLSLSAGLLLIPLPLVVRDGFDRVIPEGQTPSLLILGALLVALQILSGACTLWARTMLLRATKHAIAALRTEAVATLYERSRRYYASRPPSVLHDTVVLGTERIDIMSNALLAELLPSVVLSVGIAVVLVSLNWWLFLLMAAVLPANVIAGRLLGRQVRHRTQRFNAAFEQFSRGVLFSIRAVDLTRIHAAEDLETRRLGVRIEDLRSTSADMAALGTGYTLVQQTLIAVAGVVVLVAGGSAVASGAMTTGALLSFFAGLMLLRMPLNVIMASVPRIIEGTQSLDAVMAFLAEDDRCPYTGTARVAFTGHLELRDVTFAYDSGPDVLQHVSLTMRPGETVALVGPNGAGKSTLVSLVLGFHRPQQGSLSADGIAYDALDIRSLRQQMGVVMQDPIMVPGTIRHNLMYGAVDSSWEDALAAARRTGVDRFVADLPLGYDTPIGEDGERLSGGQKQRLSIARALLGRPALLILDEPLNHLDESDGTRFFEGLSDDDHAPAILLISHRPDVLAAADRVVRLEAGHVVEPLRAAEIA
jgi:ABC-type multidrug transport system fused ATPase/permease subunit